MNIKILWFVCGLLLSIGSNSFAGEFINKHLPSYLKADVEFRYRMEYKNNFDFDKQKDDADAYNLYRTRVSLTFNPLKQTTFFIQGQDARVSNLSTGTKSLMQNFWDIRQLYGKYEEDVHFEKIGLNKLYLQAGRLEFLYGAERLIGGFNWSNVAQSFDGARVGLSFDKSNALLDIFAGDKVAFRTPQQSSANMFYNGASKDRIYAYYATIKNLYNTLIENYFIHRQTWKNISFGPSGTGEIDNYTFGGRLKRKFKNGLDYELELASQWGNFNDRDVRAMMAVGIIGYTFDLKWQPRIAFEFDYGSGDSDPSDSTLRTFDNLYPTNHPFYGYMDLMSLQNINDYRYQISIKPTKKLKLQSDLHMLFLDTPKDAFYSASRTVTRSPVAGLSGVSSFVGSEVDLLGDYKLNSYLSFQLGYSHLFPGSYLKQTGANNDADFVYFQTLITF